MRLFYSFQVICLFIAQVALYKTLYAEPAEKKEENKRDFYLKVLRDFVHDKKDEAKILHYKKDETESSGDLYSGRFYSGSWLSSLEVKETSWEHGFHLYIPASKSATGANKPNWLILYVGEGHNHEDPKMNPVLTQLSRESGADLMAISHIPNQPLHFVDLENEQDRKNGIWEDRLIAYAWDKYLHSKDSKWIPRLPMIRAAIRGIDMASVIANKEKKTSSYDHVIVIGASKRGWVSWLAPLVDERIKGIVPIVIDILNVEKSLDHHKKTLGFWSQALKEYEDKKITDRYHTEAFKELMAHIDPYNFKDLLTLPKLIINAANDPFFLPDSSQFYFDELMGTSYLRYLPNTGHVLKGFEPDRWLIRLFYNNFTDLLIGRPSVVDSIVPFVKRTIESQSMPTIHFKKDADKKVQIVSSEPVVRYTYWQARNDKLDFRRFLSPFFMPKYKIISEEKGSFLKIQFSLKSISSGHAAHLVVCEFADGMTVTSPVWTD